MHTRYSNQDSPLASFPSCLQAAEQQEWRLVSRCKDGDARAWSLLMKRYERPIYRYAYRLCRNREQAQDIVGQSLLQLCRGISTFRHSGRFSTWLFRIVHNSFVDLSRSERHTLSIDGEPADEGERWVTRDLADPEPAPIDVCIQREELCTLKNAIQQLPATQGEALWQFYMNGRTYSDIASEMGISVGTVKSRMSRGRTALRHQFDGLRSA